MSGARILVVAPAWIGDTILSQPLLARLKAKRPDLPIDVLAPAWTAPVLRRMREVAEVLDSPFRHGELALRERWRLGRRIAPRRYALAVVLPNSFKSALVPYFAGIPIRAGYLGEARRVLLTVVHRLDKAKLPLMAERYVQLAELPNTPFERPLPLARLNHDPTSRASAQARFELALDRPVLALCPGAEFGPAKRWPVEHFAELARLSDVAGAAVWLIGGPQDATLGAAITQLCPTAVNLCGRTTLDEAIDLLSCATAAVANDSGLMHVAAALGVPVIGLYGSSSPAHTPPLAQRTRLLNLQLECSPCFERECPLGHLRCLRELTPQRVFDALGELAGERLYTTPS